MKAADKLELTGKNYVWIVAQSIIGDNLEGKASFPVGMLGEYICIQLAPLNINGPNEPFSWNEMGEGEGFVCEFVNLGLVWKKASTLFF